MHRTAPARTAPARTATAVSALGLAAALLVSGCSADVPAPAGSASASAPSSTATASTASAVAVSAEHGDADVMFAQMMIPHHEQAVEMSGIILDKQSVPEDVRALARRIQDAQGPEIERMHAMLEAWGADAASGHGGHAGHGMPGMVDEGALDAMRAKPAEGAVPMFLGKMIGHHEGALEMARTELADGVNPEAKALAQQMVDAQQAEIIEMKQLKQQLGRG